MNNKLRINYDDTLKNYVLIRIKINDESMIN